MLSAQEYKELNKTGNILVLYSTYEQIVDGRCKIKCKCGKTFKTSINEKVYEGFDDPQGSSKSGSLRWFYLYKCSCGLYFKVYYYTS